MLNEMGSEAPQSALHAIFSRTFVAISLINMLGMIGYYAIFVVCTRYLMDGFSASASTAGLATGIVVIGCLWVVFSPAVLFVMLAIGVF